MFDFFIQFPHAYLQTVVSAYGFTKAHDVGLQTDIATLDFSKAFDTVPTKLLSKMGDYGILGYINWLILFLVNRYMHYFKIVVEYIH
jgi:hypothetical protein